MIKSYKTELHPNNKQSTMLTKHCGASRFAYNWGLGRRIEEYKNTQKSSNAIKQHKELNALKKTNYPWLYDVSKCAPQEALRDLDKAFKNFFRRVKTKKDKAGFPKFKSRKNAKQSFRLSMVSPKAIEVDSKAVKLPRIGWIRLKESDYLPINHHILSATISYYCDKWFVSLNVEEPDKKKPKLTKKVIGIDLGIKTLAVCSNGMTFENPKILNKYEKKLRRPSKSVSRKVKGSNNREKAKKKLAKLHYKVQNIRKDCIHKMTTIIAKTKPKAVVLETLRIKNMMKNYHLARSIADCSWYESRRQLEYKLGWIGSMLIDADPFYPSSKLCSDCKCKNTGLKLSDRQWTCLNCGTIHDRDDNASYNLRDYGIEFLNSSESELASLNTNTVSSTEFQVCGEERSHPRKGRCSSAKQKLNKSVSEVELSTTNFL